MLETTQKALFAFLALLVAGCAPTSGGSDTGPRVERISQVVPLPIQPGYRPIRFDADGMLCSETRTPPGIFRCDVRGTIVVEEEVVNRARPLSDESLRSQRVRYICQSQVESEFRYPSIRRVNLVRMSGISGGWFTRRMFGRSEEPVNIPVIVGVDSPAIRSTSNPQSVTLVSTECYAIPER